MSSQRKVVRKHATRARHGRDDHVCSGIPPPTPSGSSFKSCGHSLAGATSSCGPPAGDGKPLDLTQLSTEQRSKLESFLKSSGFGPLPKAGQTLDAATMRKLAQHMRAAAAMPSKTTLRTWGDTEKNPKDGLVRQAVASSKRDDVKNLLEEGGDVDETEPKTLCTPLMLAVRDGSKEIVQLLLDYDADVTRRDKDEKTAIMEACAAGRDDLVQLLIDHGSCVADTDSSNWNSLTHAAANGHIRCAHVVMRHLKYDKESQDKLKEAVRKEEKKKKPSKDKSKNNDADDYDDDCPAESALAVAAQKGQFEFVKWYLQQKDHFKVSEPEIQAACSKACYSKRIDLLRMLIEEYSAKVNPEGPVAETPLCAAAACGDLDIVKYLLQRGARVNDSDGSGFTPLMRACNEGNSNLVPVFLQSGANVNAQNNQYENWTPLCFAILKGNMEIVQILVNAHANVNLGGTAPLLLAVSFSNAEAVEYLLAHGATPTQKSLHGDTAITFAADVGNFEWVKRFHLLGCDVDCVGDKGHTPLMKAAKKGSLEIVEYLLENGASINRVSSTNDCTALSLACSKGWIKIIECLLERGANRHAKLKDNITPLLETIKSGNAEAADLVLYHQPKNADFRELTSVQVAANRGCDHINNIGTYMKAATPVKEFYMNYSCKHCDGHHADPSMRTASEDTSEEDDEDDEDDDGDGDDESNEDDEHMDCDDEECESGDEDEEIGDDEEDYTSDSEGSDDDDKKGSIIADSENYELPEILAGDLAALDFHVPEPYDNIKEGLDADIDFIRTQLAHFQPQSFEFRILNAMLRKAEQLQKSLPNHSPEDLRRRFSEEISRWQHELQSNSNVDDLMDKLGNEPSAGREVEPDEPTLADIASFLQANPGVLDYSSVLLQRSDMFPTDSPQPSEADSKRGVSLSPDGKFIIMTNSNNNYTAPLGDFEFLRSIAAAADANSTNLANTIQHLPVDLAKVMAEAKRNGVFNMEAFSTFLQGAKEDAQFLEDYRKATQLPASFDFSNTPPASLAPLPMRLDKRQKYAVKKHVTGETGAMPKLEPRRRKCDCVKCEADVAAAQTTRRARRKMPVCTDTSCVGCGQALELTDNFNDKAKAPRTPEPTPDDTSEDGFQGSDDVPSVDVAAAMFKSAPRVKKTVRNTRDVATNVNSAAPPPKKPALVDVDQQQESDSSTPLIQAAIRGNAKMIAMLCDAGSKPNHKDKKGWTALGYAVERGHKEAVKELCEHGADIDYVMDTNQAKRDSSLTIACYNGRAEIVRTLLDYKANIEHRNSNDYTPLCVACLNGHHRVAQMLIQRGADINARGTKLGIAPLMLAAMNGHTTIVKLLIESSADVNQCIETNRNTALTLACFQGRTECVRVLVEKGANLEWRSKNGLNAMMEAANGGFCEIGKMLVEAGADMNCAPVPSTKDTPLTIAAEKGHAKFVQLLIDNGAAINVRNKKGCSPLWLACQNGHFDVVRALVSSGKVDVDSRDNRQMSCILTAFKRGHENIVKTLVDHIRCYPSEEEMTRYCKDVKLNGNNSYLLAVYERCKKAILDAKHKKEAEADAKAQSLLEELDLQQKTKEGQRAKKRDKKKQKKKTGKFDDDDSSVTGISNARTNESQPNSNPPSSVPSRSGSPARDTLRSTGKNAVAIPVDEEDEYADDPGKDGDTKSKKRKKKKGKKAKVSVEPSDQPTTTSVAETPSVDPKLKSPELHQRQLISAATNLVHQVTTEKPKVPVLVVLPKPKIATGINEPPTGNKGKPQPITSQQAQPRRAPVVSEPSVESDDDGQAGDENNLSDQGVDINGDSWVQQRSKSQRAASQLTNANQVAADRQDPARRAPLNTLKQSDGWKEVVGRSRRFKVPTTAIARIIGKGGANINAIRASTCAHIEIEKNKPGINDRLITVKGTGEAVAEAFHIIQTLVEYPDRDLEDLLRETKSNSVALTDAFKGQDGKEMVAVVPTVVPQVNHSPMVTRVVGPHSKEEDLRRGKPGGLQSHMTTHSTQVFTNSQMHRNTAANQNNNSHNVPHPPVVLHGGPAENYSSVLVSNQKRSSVHSTSSSKESTHSQESSHSNPLTTAPRAASVNVDRDAVSPAPSASNSTSNRGSPSSLPGTTSTGSWVPTLTSPGSERVPTLSSASSSSAPSRPPVVEAPPVFPPVTAGSRLIGQSSQTSSEQSKTATAPPQTALTKAAAPSPKEGNNIFGTLYKDLLSERSLWNSDMDFCFPHDLGTGSSNSANTYQPPKGGSRVLRNSFENGGGNGFDLTSSHQSSSRLDDVLNVPYPPYPHRPSSLPHQGGANNDQSRYGTLNGFISPTGFSTNNLSSFGTFSPTLGFIPNVELGGGDRGLGDPSDAESMWNSNNGFMYGDYHKEIDPSKFMGVAETLAQFEHQHAQMYGANQHYGAATFQPNGYSMDNLGYGDHAAAHEETSHHAPISGSRLIKPNGGFSQSNSSFARNGPFLGGDYNCGWNQSAGFNSFASGGAADMHNYGAIADPLPINARSALRTNPTGINGGSELKVPAPFGSRERPAF